MINANRGVPLIGQQQATQQMAVQQMAMSMYMATVPTLAVFRLDKGYRTADGLAVEVATLDRITQEAQDIVDAALARIGIAKPAQPPT